MAPGGSQQKAPKDTSARESMPPYPRKSMESGLITRGAVAETRMPDTAVTESLNMHFDAIGGATLRPGLTALGNNVTNSICGMHYFVDTVSPNTYTQLIIAQGTKVQYLSAGTWTDKRTSLTGGSRARFSTFLNFTFMVNGTEATAVWDGNPSDNFVTTGNASGAPTGTLIENFQQRMWIAGNATYPARVFYSSVPTAVTTPVVTWNTDVTTGQWIDVSPSDGDFMTALQRFRNTLLIFKTNHLYRLFGIGQVDADPWYAVGTSSQESVVETKAGVFFHHSTGIYQYNIYGIVQEISRPIIDIIKAIPTTAYANIVGWIDPLGDHVCWYVGSVTIGGILYSNLVVRYTISTQVWTHYSYPYAFTASLRRAPLYVAAGAQYALLGDSAGDVFEADTGLTDNGKPIAYSLIHRWETVDGLLSTRKTAMVANFSHYGGAGSSVAFQTQDNDPDTLNDWTKKIGPLGVKNTGFNTMNVKARKMRFRVFGQSTGQPFVYLGYEMLGVTPEFLQFPPN